VSSRSSPTAVAVRRSDVRRSGEPSRRACEFPGDPRLVGATAGLVRPETGLEGPNDEAGPPAPEIGPRKGTERRGRPRRPRRSVRGMGPNGEADPAGPADRSPKWDRTARPGRRTGRSVPEEGPNGEADPAGPGDRSAEWDRTARPTHRTRRAVPRKRTERGGRPAGPGDRSSRLGSHGPGAAATGVAHTPGNRRSATGARASSGRDQPVARRRSIPLSHSLIDSHDSGGGSSPRTFPSLVGDPAGRRFARIRGGESGRVLFPSRLGSRFVIPGRAMG
jgi:hypothetical protein